MIELGGHEVLADRNKGALARDAARLHQKEEAIRDLQVGLSGRFHLFGQVKVLAEEEGTFIDLLLGVAIAPFSAESLVRVSLVLNESTELSEKWLPQRVLLDVLAGDGRLGSKLLRER